MDIEEKIGIIRGAAQEIVTEDELRALLQQKADPIAYDGFEPSGLAHLPVGVYRPLLLKEFMRTGIRFKLLLADSFAWINGKLGGDLEKIRLVGKYFLEVWEAAGVDMSKVEVVWHKDLFDSGDYWDKVMRVAKSHSEKRTKRCLTIAGRKEDEVKETAQLFYPSMQVADVFQLGVDICQLGMDQRKANMLAREIAPALGFKKPVAIHHRMLLGLDGYSSASAADEAAKKEMEIEAKMSKSKPATCIFVHDSADEIAKKMAKAYCPPKIVEGNPVMEYAREIVFRAFPSLEIKRDAKFGGTIQMDSYAALEKEFAAGKIHPMDLKNAVAGCLDELIEPVRSHFEKDADARKLYEQVKGFEATR
ncbi:MAG: tyrosine--tRNA ligase [Candidatus Micrarchaeota archaeon]|nr:tyrosine--tRNA ligase [Candidatus Micrarchaeota archaeon]